MHSKNIYLEYISKWKNNLNLYISKFPEACTCTIFFYSEFHLNSLFAFFSPLQYILYYTAGGFCEHEQFDSNLYTCMYRLVSILTPDANAALIKDTNL